MFLQRWLGTRFVVLRKSSGTDQLAHQLSRIADSLEKLAVQSGPSPPTEKLPVDEPLEQPRVDKPPVEKPSIPLQSAPQPSEVDQKNPTRKPTVTLACLCLAARPTLAPNCRITGVAELSKVTGELLDTSVRCGVSQAIPQASPSLLAGWKTSW